MLLTQVCKVQKPQSLLQEGLELLCVGVQLCSPHTAGLGPPSLPRVAHSEPSCSVPLLFALFYRWLDSGTEIAPLLCHCRIRRFRCCSTRSQDC